MNTNKATKLMMMYGLAAMMGADESMYSSHKEFTEDEYGRMKAVKRPIKKIIPKNHKEFFYGLNSVFALNRKNADKKAKAKGYL